MRTQFTVVRGFLAALVAVSMVGCTDKSNGTPKGKTRPGVVTKIDLQTRAVAMKIKTDDGVEQEHSGTISDDTEILINGRAAKLADVRIGEKVDVTVQKSKTEDGKFDIKRVEITRTSDSDWKSTSDTAGTTSTSNAPATPTNGTVNPTPTPTPTPAPTEPRAKADPATPTPVPDVGMANNDQEAAKQDLTDLIYAQIRVRMEEALARRELLLKENTPQSDPRVAEFERQILRARSFLSERGELLNDVTPPLAGMAAPETPSAQAP